MIVEEETQIKLKFSTIIRSNIKVQGGHCRCVKNKRQILHLSIRQSPIPKVRSADPIQVFFPIPQSGFLRLFKPFIGINVDSKEGEKRERETQKDESSKTGKSRVQPADQHQGHDDRERQQRRTPTAPRRLSLRADPVIRRRDIK